MRRLASVVSFLRAWLLDLSRLSILDHMALQRVSRMLAYVSIGYARVPTVSGAYPIDRLDLDDVDAVLFGADRANVTT
jgi:hypothetical protein